MSLASRGLRDLDSGAAPIADELERRALEVQARKVLTESGLWAAALTALSTALPL